VPAATNTSDLLAVTLKDYGKLDTLLAELSDEQVEHPSKDDSISIKQVIGHRAHWVAMFFRWYQDGLEGRPVHIPAEGYKWNQLKPYNATLYEAAAKRPWAEVRADLTAEHEKLVAFIKERDDDELYHAGVHAWTGKWTLGRWVEASGASHYRSAAKFVRQVLRELA